MTNKIATMALMAIMIICSAATCTNDDEYDGNIDNLLNLWDTSWQATHFWDYDMWVTSYDYNHRFTITFHNTTYEANYSAGAGYNDYGQPISGQTSYYAGDCRVRDRYIYCYDGRSNDERLRFEVIRYNEFEMEANVYLAKRNETVRVILNRQ